MIVAALPHARSCIVESDGQWWAALLVAFASDENDELYGVLALDDGGLTIRPIAKIVVKYPPHGDDRLLLGWAEKGGR